MSTPLLPNQAASADSPPIHQQQALQQKLHQLKEERAELYKQQGLHATQVLTLNDQLRAKDASLSLAQAKLAEAEERLRAERLAAEEAKRRFKEKEMEAKAIGDELVALHLEMLRHEERERRRDVEATLSVTGPVITSGSSNATAYATETSSPGLNTFALPQLTIVKEKELTAPHQYPITAVSGVAEKRLLLTGSEDQKIILYDLTRISTRAVLKWSSINGAIVALAGSAAEMIASCAAYDQEVTLWNSTSGRVVGTLPFKAGKTRAITIKLMFFRGKQCRNYPQIRC